MAALRRAALRQLVLPLGLLAVVAWGCGEDTAEDALQGSAGGFVRTAAIERGRKLYQRHGCATCHGLEGRGDGHTAQALSPAPANFHDPDSFERGRSIEALSHTIAEGIVVDGGRWVMPAFEHIQAADRRNMAIFIRSLADSAAGGRTPDR